MRRPLGFALALLAVFSSDALQAAPQPPAEPRIYRLPAGVEVVAERIQRGGDGSLVLEGAPTLRWQNARFQADRMVLHEGKRLEAEGNVLVVWGGNRISGRRLTYDLEQDLGTIEDAIGVVEPEFYFSADRVQKVGEDRLFLESATVTTCTQPVPYWSFSVSSARVKVDRYAHLRNLRLNVRGAPVFYLPYMVWPVRPERSAGLLFPNLGTTERRGRVVTQPLFLPLGRSADLTLVAEYYTEAGLGGGTELRFVPNPKGHGVFNGFFIRDRVVGADRWRISYNQTQQFRNGFRMVADINQVSDFNYFTDFERDLRLVSSPMMLARVEFARNGRWTSVNVRELRREQLVAGGSLVQQTLPELEFRGRNRRLGRSPFYFAYESSFTSIAQQGVTLRADYLRGDFFPTFSLPVSPLPWLDVTPRASYRLTYYTQRRDPVTGTIVDAGLLRGVAGAGIDIVGPKFFRIFERGRAERRAKFKHQFEPRVGYTFRDRFEREAEVIRFDEVDLSLARNLLNYGLRSRLFVKRPRAEAPPVDEVSAVILPEATHPLALGGPGQLGRERLPPPPASGVGAPSVEPLEIATLEITQNRSFDDRLTCADLDGDGIAERTSHVSEISVVGRFNPSPATNFDLRGLYHPLYRQIQDVSLSGNVRQRTAAVGFSVVRRNGRSCSLFGARAFPVVREDDTQLRLNSAFSAFGGKLRFAFDGSFNANPPPGANRVPDRRFQIEYYTQCCGVLIEYLARDFAVASRQELRFTVDLRGIGKFLDLHHGEDR